MIVAIKESKEEASETTVGRRRGGGHVVVEAAHGVCVCVCVCVGWPRGHTDKSQHLIYNLINKCATYAGGRSKGTPTVAALARVVWRECDGVSKATDRGLPPHSLAARTATPELHCLWSERRATSGRGLPPHSVAARTATPELHFLLPAHCCCCCRPLLPPPAPRLWSEGLEGSPLGCRTDGDDELHFLLPAHCCRRPHHGGPRTLLSTTARVAMTTTLASVCEAYLPLGEPLDDSTVALVTAIIRGHGLLSRSVPSSWPAALLERLRAPASSSDSSESLVAALKLLRLTLSEGCPAHVAASGASYFNALLVVWRQHDDLAARTLTLNCLEALLTRLYSCPSNVQGLIKGKVGVMGGDGGGGGGGGGGGQW